VARYRRGAALFLKKEAGGGHLERVICDDTKTSSHSSTPPDVAEREMSVGNGRHRRYHGGRYRVERVKRQLTPCKAQYTW